MNVAHHAEQILAAWRRADPTSFEQELNAAMLCCQRAEPVNYFESEQREVLASVVERLQLIRQDSFSPHGLRVGFSLLEHLRQRSAA